MHAYIVGMTDSGKTWLSKRFAQEYANKGHNIIVFDPIKSSGWPSNAVKYASPEKFLGDMPSFENAYVFIDEGKTLWDHDQVRANRLLYQKRHDGIYVFLIAQRYNMIPPNARNMCSKIYAFRQQNEDAKLLCKERHETMDKTRQFEEGEFIAATSFKMAHCRLNFSAGLPPTYEAIKK